MTRETTRDLPRLIDRRGLEEELGIKRAAAEAIMRCLDDRLVRIPGLRKAYVRRDDVRDLLDRKR